MVTTYLVLETVEDVRKARESNAWSVYARFSGRQDSPIYDTAGVRESDGELWANAGEWSPTKGYLNEEWIKPQFVYMKHMCDGCHYPPDMCCMQRSSHDPFDRYDDWEHDYDDDDDDDDAYEQALAELGEYPKGVYPRIIEL